MIGGVLLTGGYGSAIGAVFGALIFGMVRQGIVFMGVDPDWFKVFLGAMLLIAVLVNNYIRTSSDGSTLMSADRDRPTGHRSSRSRMSRATSAP